MGPLDRLNFGSESSILQEGLVNLLWSVGTGDGRWMVGYRRLLLADEEELHLALLRELEGLVISTNREDCALWRPNQSSGADTFHNLRRLHENSEKFGSLRSH
ncbi:hypothetical protein QJS10_CPB21g01194 [Acorus calamus]|uniref:Uncharacterized protein n=1 Tax=Acorus calamus TaxID=4465 RepID=A0AAV9C4T8_ACOCL|nr:hypothetical protein QJS10_CPB21g01194 [Acorus calamus]